MMGQFIPVHLSEGVMREGILIGPEVVMTLSALYF